MHALSAWGHVSDRFLGGAPPDYHPLSRTVEGTGWRQANWALASVWRMIHDGSFVGPE